MQAISSRATVISAATPRYTSVFKSRPTQATMRGMGAWHYQLNLSPAASIGVDPDEPDLWAGEQPSTELLNDLRELLPRNTSWPGGAVEEYRANLDGGSYLRIWRDEHGEAVRAIDFKFSSMGDDRLALNRVLELSAKNNLALYSPATSRWLKPTLEDVLCDLRATRLFGVFWERSWIVAADGTSIERRPTSDGSA